MGESGVEAERVLEPGGGDRGDDERDERGSDGDTSAVAFGIPIEMRFSAHDGDLSSSSLTYEGLKLLSTIRLLIFGLNVRCSIANLPARFGSSHQTRGGI